eukprot:gene13937-19871_t
MGGACCKNHDVELNPDDTPKDPQTEEQMKEDCKDLRRATKEADWTQIRMLMRRMPSNQINSRVGRGEGSDEDIGKTALHFSVAINHLKGMRKLIRYGHSVMTPDGSGATPFQCAVEAGRLKAVEILLGAEETQLGRWDEPTKARYVKLINKQDAEGRSPFLAVVTSGRKKLASWLMEKMGEDINYGLSTLDYQEGNGNTLPLLAAKYGWFDSVEMFLEKLTDTSLVNTRNSEGETVLGWVLKYNAGGLMDNSTTCILVKMLLEKGAMAKIPCFMEAVPPINLAAAANNIEVYNMLIQKGADPVLEKDAVGRSALHYAAAKGSIEACKLLTELGMKPYLLDKQGNTPLHLASMRGQGQAVQFLLTQADDIVIALTTPNKQGLSTYHLALKAGPDEAAQENSKKIIHQLGPASTRDIMQKKLVMDTPLMLAIGGHQDKVVKDLLERGCDVNKGTHAGELPIARNLGCVSALTYDHDATIFDILVQAGADINKSSEAKHPLLAICKFKSKAGPVAESEIVVDKNGKKVMKVDMTMKNRADALVCGTPGEKLWANEPYYQPATRYKGMPKYMDENKVPTSVLIDISKPTTSIDKPGTENPELIRMLESDFVPKSKGSKGSLYAPGLYVYVLATGLWNVNARLKEYKPVKEQQAVSADLRQRNIKWYLKSMSPQEFPLAQGKWSAFLEKCMKAEEEFPLAQGKWSAFLEKCMKAEEEFPLAQGKWSAFLKKCKKAEEAEFPLAQGKWSAFLKKCKKAEEAARQRRPLQPGKKAAPKKTSWFGGADVPTRPELNSTSPLVLAVRLGRISCVQTLLKHSPSINIPDGFGVTPIQYALFLLLKERHNKVSILFLVVQQVTDLIVSHLPFTSSRVVVQEITDLILSHLPFASSRATASIYLLPRAVKALANAQKAGARPKVLRNLEDQVLDLKTFQPVNHPTLMDPMVLATLLNDMPRLAWLVFRCAGNLNDSYVALPDIPTYLQGQWEKMAGNCRSKVLPLHVGVMQKKLDTVRLMLDMGADPNTFGVEYSGNLKKDIKKRRSLFREKSQEVKDQIEAGASAIPYARLWTNPVPGMLKMLSGIKHFVTSIEIPGITRPQPWVSPLHLSCRFGQASITYLLIKRGAMPNGGGAAVYAKKSPLEEALSYARSNCQSYNTLADRANFEKVMKLACWETSKAGAGESQMSALADIKLRIQAKAERVLENNPKKYGGMSVEGVLALLSSYVPGSLGDFSYMALRDVAVPPMNEACLANKMMNAMKSLGDIFDPVAMSIKAACLAAKIVVKILLKMIKRPIAHWDPALNTAHHLDMTSDPKKYKKYARLLDSQFNQQYMNTSLEFFMPAYFMPVLRKHIAVVGGDRPSSGQNMSRDEMKKGAAKLYEGYIMSQVQSQKERLIRACYDSNRSKADSDASMPSPELVGRELLGWAQETAADIKADVDRKYLTLDADRARDGELSSAAKSSQMRLDANTQAFAEWRNQAPKTLIDLEPAFQAMADKVNAGMLPKCAASFNPSDEDPKDFSGLDTSNNFLGQLADGSNGLLVAILQKFDMSLLEDKKRSPEDLTVADMVKALQIAYIGMVEEKRKMMTEKVKALSSADLAFDEDALFSQAMHQVNWEIIGKKLGPNGPNIVSLLTSIDPPLNSIEVLALAKESVGEGMEALFLGKLKLTGKVPQDALSAMVKAGTDEALAPVDAMVTAMTMAMEEWGEDGAKAVKALELLKEAGSRFEFPKDPQAIMELLHSLGEAAIKGGVQSLMVSFTQKGMQLPDVEALPQLFEDVENFDASSVASVLLDMGTDFGGDFFSKLIAPLPGMKSKLVNNPLTKELLRVSANNQLEQAREFYNKKLEELLRVSANNQLEQMREFYNKKLETLELDMISNATCGMEEMTSIANLGQMFEQAMANILDNLGAEGERVIDEMILGFQLDLSVDLEGLAAAMQGAQDAFVTILEFLEIDPA